MIKYIGVNDHNLDLFEGQYKVLSGMAYNSYIIIDEKIAVLDTMEAHYGDEWFEKLENELNGRSPDYLIVHHMEPDHSANIAAFMEKYPNAQIAGSMGAFNIMKNYFGTDFPERKLVLKDGSTIELGEHTLSFLSAPMVHWPEVMMSYESKEKVLFSADAFGKFGALDAEDNWIDEARRYYFGIVGKFGAMVQAVLKKTQALDIKTICPLHGPILTENLEKYIGLYDTWSKYDAEDDEITIAYTSVYGHTKEAVLHLYDELSKNGKKATVFDLARTDMSEAISSAFRHKKLILATTTYNNEIFPFMYTFIHELSERNFQNRRLALIENGSWAPQAVKIMTELLSTTKNNEIATTITIKGSLNEENEKQIAELAQTI